MLPDELRISNKHLRIRGRNVDKNTGFSITKFLVLTILLIHASGCFYMVDKEQRFLMEGQYSEAEKLMESRINDYSSAKSSDLMTLCYSYAKLKKYNKLFSCLEQLENNIQKGDNKGFRGGAGTSGCFPYDITAYPCLLRAEAYIELGNYVKAIEYAQKAHELIINTEPPSEDKFLNWDKRNNVRALSLLALAYALNGERNKALECTERLKNAPTGFTASIPIKMEKSLGLAKAYMALEEYDEILSNKENFEYALGKAAGLIFGSSFAGENLFAHTELPKQFMMTKSLYETGHLMEAKKGYENLLNNPSTQFVGELYWPILVDMGRIAKTEGNIERAIEFFKKAIEVIETQRSTINTEANKIGFVGDKQKVYHHIISALFANSQYTAAFEYVERAKSRALVDLLAENKNFAPENPQIDSMLTELDSLELEAKVQRLSGENVKQMKERSIEIKEKVHAVAPELYSLVSVSVPSPSEIQLLIAPDETIIEYYYFAKDLYVFIITGNDIKAQRLGGANLVGEVEGLRKALETADSRNYSELSRKLYYRLIRPIEHLVHTKNLIIVPHGILHYLPFNALYNGEEYLIDRYCLSYLPSSSVMKFLKKRKIRGGERILVFGNPDLGDPKYDLKYAEKEALTISKIFPESKVFLRSEATETAFKKIGTGFNYIHFACHGMFDAGSPLNSGIYLGKDLGNDGHLTVGELYSTRLNAELVTLSACETGMGTIKQGDDVVGLTRGFLYAGSNSIVASLWNVDDIATSQLMAEFYSRLGRTDKREALRDAQLAVKTRYEHPYYWAAFQITGKTE